MTYTKRGNPTIRERMIDLGQSREKSVKELCELFGFSRKTYYIWKQRFDPENKITSLMDRKSTPKTQHRKTPKEFERIIIKIHDKLDWKALKIHMYLKNNNIVNPSTDKPIAESTIRAILKRYKRNLKQSKKEEVIRYEKENPGDMAHADVKKLSNVKGEDPKKKKYLAVIEDDATRLVYAEIIDNKKAETLAQFLKRSTFWFNKTFDIKFEKLLTDNGKEFTWHSQNGKKFHSFEVMCRFLDIDHKYTRVARPQTNGKVERFNRTIDEELFKKYHFASHKERSLALNEWLRKYNHGRMHMGIKGMTPAQKLEKCRKITLHSDNKNVA
jgi:transposase InsO family protein/transposase-like protein